MQRLWCLLDATGQTVERGKIATTVPELRTLLERLKAADEFVVGQELGKMAYPVHDKATAIGMKILSFNAWHLRMIASSRKKTDRRDAYWVAKALQTGITPTLVYMPKGEVRELRALLSRRQALLSERTRWLLRSRSFLEAAGYSAVRRTVPRRAPRLHRQVLRSYPIGQGPRRLTHPAKGADAVCFLGGDQSAGCKMAADRHKPAVAIASCRPQSLGPFQTHEKATPDFVARAGSAIALPPSIRFAVAATTASTSRFRFRLFPS